LVGKFVEDEVSSVLGVTPVGEDLVPGQDNWAAIMGFAEQAGRPLENDAAANVRTVVASKIAVRINED
jgi:hypothetical protein